jgi:hypothetical protein
MGWAYYSRVGIPSITSKGDHNFHPAEQDANSRAFTYFNNHIANYSGWVHTGRNANTIVGYDQSRPYDNVGNQLALSNALISAKWYDYASWIIPVLGPVVVGFINSNQYNN